LYHLRALEFTPILRLSVLCFLFVLWVFILCLVSNVASVSECPFLIVSRLYLTFISSYIIYQSCRTLSYVDDSHSVGFMVFNATFNNISVISWRSVLIGWGNGGPGEHRLAASHRRTLSHNAVSSTSRPDRDSKSQHQWW
jgi:hypothetical protein